MRALQRFAITAVTGAMIVGCSEQKPTSPALSSDIVSATTIAQSVLSDARSAPIIGALHFPDALKLTGEQESQIRQLLDAFQTANAADIAALQAILTELNTAQHSGATRDQLRAILERARPIRERLAAAHHDLETQLWATLTQEQRDYINTQRQACRPTPAQAQQIQGLFQAFEQANAADLATERQLMQQVAQAVHNGATREQVQAILASGGAARERLTTAREALVQQVRQIMGANGCELPPPPGQR